MGEGQEPRRLIRLTEAAKYDLAAVDNTTTAIWGEQQAERYIAFVQTVLGTLAENPRLGMSVDDFPGVLVYSAKIVNRKSAHGHRIFYREIEGGIRVIRILHSAMNWPDHLYEPPSN